MSWILSLIPTGGIIRYFQDKSTRSPDQWIGPIEAIVAFAYNRFRPGAKLKISSFRITNDHSHALNIYGEYTFDMQSIKRTVLGGKAADMYNLKNPIYHSLFILNLLPQEKCKFLLELTLQSVNNMMNGIYAEDGVALECLHVIRQILTTALNGDRLADLQSHLRINNDYLRNPLTQHSMRVWQDHLDLLETICDELAEAYEKNKRGEDYKLHLRSIRTILDKVGDETATFYDTIIRGR